MVNFDNLRWSSVGAKTYDVTNKQGYYSLKLRGTSKRIFRIDWTHENFLEHSLFVGYLHGTVNIFGGEAIVIHQKMYLGSNLVIIPSEIESIESFYLNHYSKFYGKYTIQGFEPTVQVVINPFTNQPVILGQDALNSIENINELYSQQVIDELSKKITIQVSQELQQIENQTKIITTLLSSVV